MTRALCNIKSLEKITFSNNLKTVKANNLWGSKVTTMNLLNTKLEKLSLLAFNSMKHLTTVLLPSTLTTIEEGVFEDDPKLTKIIYNGTID